MVRYVKVPEDAVDTDLLQDATRREAAHVAAQQKAATAAATSE